MKYFFIIIAVFFSLLTFAYFVAPNNLLPIGFIINTVILFIICGIAIYLTLIRTNYKISSGIIFISMLFAFMFIGSLNYYLVIYIFPKYTKGIEKTQTFWILYSSLFIVGYLLTLKKSSKLRSYQTIIPSNNVTLIWLLIILGLLGTIIGIINIGYIPLLTPGAGVRRYAGEEGMGSLATKLWVINIISGLLSLQYYLQNNKKIYLFIYIIIILELTLFIIRFYFVLGILLGLILFFRNKTLNKSTIAKIIVVVLFLGIINTLYLENRSGNENLLQQRGGRYLNAIQNRFIYSTFNEFMQLNDLIHNNNKHLNGKTFLSIPISLMPSEFWEAFGISKSKVQNLNSATILADEMGTSGGLRTGLGGELYINFGYWGVVLMLFFGALFGHLDNLYRKSKENDMRKVFFLIFIGILIYSAFVGQINAVASMVVFYLYIYIFLNIFFKKSLPLIVKST